MSAGFTAPAKFKVQQILRGDLASATHMQLAGLSVQDAERAEKGYWRQQMDWVEPDTAAWRYDDVQNMLILSMTGRERRNPDLIKASRKRRIALGSGTDVQDVNKLLKQYQQMADVMKKASKLGTKGFARHGLGGLLPPGGMGRFGR